MNNRVKTTNDLDLKDRLVAINRVTKVTKGGRAFTFAAIVVVGNENGIVGWGLGKANEVQAAIAKGVEAAKKNLIRVPVHKGTIPHEQIAKFGGSRIILKPASHGTGVKAGGAMRASPTCLLRAKVRRTPTTSLKPLSPLSARCVRPRKSRRTVASVSNKYSKAKPPMAQIKIKQIKSRINCPAVQKRTLDALGLRKMNHTVVKEDTPSVMGMVNTVRHLVEVTNA